MHGHRERHSPVKLNYIFEECISYRSCLLEAHVRSACVSDTKSVRYVIPMSGYFLLLWMPVYNRRQRSHQKYQHSSIRELECLEAHTYFHHKTIVPLFSSITRCSPDDRIFVLIFTCIALMLICACDADVDFTNIFSITLIHDTRL